MGGSEVMAESILILVHADETGSALSAESLEAVTAGRELAARLDASIAIGIVAEDAKAVASSIFTYRLRLVRCRVLLVIRRHPYVLGSRY